MKVTVITISYNDITGLEKTLRSVSEQTYEDIEHIVVDGGTYNLDITKINKLKRFAGVFISEYDHGIYYAMNKGLDQASGRYICFLNSGDVYAYNEVVEDYVNEIHNTGFPSAVYAHLKFIRENKCVRSWYSTKFSRNKFLFGWMMPHPTVFARSDILSGGSRFDTKFRIASDYDWMLRTFYFYGFRPVMLDKVTILMEAGGISNSSLRSVMSSNIEVLKSWYKYYRFVPIWLPFLKPLIKLAQLLK